MRVQDVGLRVEGLGFRVEGLGRSFSLAWLRVENLEFENLWQGLGLGAARASYLPRVSIVVPIFG